MRLLGRGLWRTVRSTGLVTAARRHYGLYEDFDVFLNRQGGLRIEGYYDAGFFFNGVKHEGSVICLGKVVFKWSPTKPSEISPASLSIFQLVRPAPELLILGVGKRIVPLPSEVREFMKSNGMKAEVVDTRNAASTFNFLSEEGRQVAVALLPQGAVDS